MEEAVAEKAALSEQKIQASRVLDASVLIFFQRSPTLMTSTMGFQSPVKTEASSWDIVLLTCSSRTMTDPGVSQSAPYWIRGSLFAREQAIHTLASMKC